MTPAPDHERVESRAISTPAGRNVTAQQPRPRGPRRVGIAEDHNLVARGLMGLLHAAGVDAVLAATVPGLLHIHRSQARLDLAVLDLRLADDSSVTDNVHALRQAGLPVLVLTSAESPALLREAARADVLGIVRKSLTEGEIRDAVLEALHGRPVTSLEWAAAVDGDPLIQDAGLTEREREILGLYAAGVPAKAVARATGLSAGTVANYISRIRAKYTAVGRPAASRVDLYRLAAEDHLIEGRE
ncbi:response regulator transcription factor [Bogoriella caseilytica]|uniref:LuxR family two component transcriptional regulator n=1 Tax=Bogoriella caseilytica TaxID=56055 RepID=A0A3N2BG32_9MICO|nr:response regulator transcription factor [Bogoriella caseilytica]ROR74178.1 LuxR family two component transcriptional regulator [Bogoriella caseilytica]